MQFTEQQAELAAAEYARIVRQSTAVAKENCNTEWKSADGIGHPVARISRDEYMLARQVYGDYCWDDPDFVRAWIRDNPQCRVKISRGTRGQEILKNGN